MFEGQKSFESAAPADASDCIAPVHAMLSLIRDLAPTDASDIAVQHVLLAGTTAALSTRYAAANTITRRRFDALIREAETVGTIGLKLIIARGGRSDPGTIAAARFLGRSLETLVRKLENLMPSQTAQG